MIGCGTWQSPDCWTHVKETDDRVVSAANDRKCESQAPRTECMPRMAWKH